MSSYMTNPLRRNPRNGYEPISARSTLSTLARAGEYFSIAFSATLVSLEGVNIVQQTRAKAMITSPIMEPSVIPVILSVFLSPVFIASGML